MYCDHEIYQIPDFISLTNNFRWGGRLVGFDLMTVVSLFVDSGDSSSGRIGGVLKGFVPFDGGFGGTSNGFTLNRYRFLGLKNYNFEFPATFSSFVLKLSV